MIQASAVRRRRRRWPFVLLVLLLLSAGLWTGVWYFAAGKAQDTIAGWRAREAQSGRLYSCASQTIEGFPFGFALRCAGAGVELTSSEPPLAVHGMGMLISAKLWQPTLLEGEFLGPVTVAAPGQPAAFSAGWRRARTELRGLPTAPEHVSLAVEQPVVDRVAAGNLFRAARLQLDGRILSGSVRDHPVLEVALKLAAASAPGWHPAAAVPVDADITAILRGLDDFSPKPWPARFRQLQAAGGRIEIARARVQQGETVAIANGTLGLSPGGRLNGQLQLTIANLEKLMPALGIDRMMAEGSAPPQVESAIGALDRLLPGLGNVARKNAGPALAAGITLMGRPAVLEGKRAVILPLRFDDGAASLGPFLLGYVPPLF